MSDEIPGQLLDVLRDIGLDAPDLTDPLHRKLVATLRRLGPGATFGNRIVALRFDFNWELRDAGMVFAQAKANYEHAVSRRVTQEMARGSVDGRRMSLGWAQAIAEEATYTEKLTYLVAEQRERAMRKFLDSLEAALDNFRTMSADARAADRAHAQGIEGHA